MRSTRSRILVGVLAAVSWLPAAATAGADTVDGADIAVRLSATASPIPSFPGARYTITITNNGPQPLASATVVLRTDPRILSAIPTAPCTFDDVTDTFSCPFGALPVGTTATATAFVYFRLPSNVPDNLDATATLTTSSPTDPNATNDTANFRCRYYGWQPGIPAPVWPPSVFC